MYMKKTINVQITHGEKYYVAESLDLPIVTQAKTLGELMVNVREAVDLVLADGDFTIFNVIRNPLIMTS